MSKINELMNGSRINNYTLELDTQNHDAIINNMKRRFYLYSNNHATEEELNKAVFNFLGFVETSIKIANDNNKKE